jgi:hypothetical protein
MEEIVTGPQSEPILSADIRKTHLSSLILSYILKSLTLSGTTEFVLPVPIGEQRTSVGATVRQ